MNVLMISIGSSLLEGSRSGAVDRHVEYARLAGGRLDMIAFSTGRGPRDAVAYDGFTVYPSGSRGQLTFVADALRVARRLYRERSYDVIYTQDPFGTALAGLALRRMYGTPLIIGNHSNLIDNEDWIAERPVFFRFLNQVARRTIARADRLRVLNEEERDKYLELGLPKSRVEILNTPCNIRRFNRVLPPASLIAARERLGLDGDTPLILWVGRPVRVKRIPFLYDVFRRVRDRVTDARLLMIGNRKLQQDDLSGAQGNAGLGDEVIWLDQGVSHSELPLYYQMADVYAHTSSYEGFGKVMVEAAASGLPIVATDSAGARRIVRNGLTGFLVGRDDAAGAAERITELLRNRPVAVQLGNAGRQSAREEWDPARNIEQIVDLWRRTAMDAGSRRA